MHDPPLRPRTELGRAGRPRPWRDHLPGDVDVDALDLVRRRTLPAAWAEVWARDPTAPVLLDASRADAGWCRAGELDERSRARARDLGRIGVGAGDRVLWCVSSSLDAVVANVAALRSGIVVVPVNPAYTARELAHVIDDVRPAAAVVDDAERGRTIGDVTDHRLTVLSTGFDVLAAAEEPPEPVEAVLDGAEPQDPALIAYTSGTTGAPKGAVLTHRNLLANSESVALAWRWDVEDRLVHALPVFHGHGLCVALYTSLLTGASSVLLPRFEVGEVLDAVARHRATLFFGVPTMYHRIVESGRAAELARLRLAVSGSAALRPELHAGVARAAGLAVLERYGMTETLMTLSNPYDGERRPGTVGFPFPGVDAFVQDDAARPSHPASEGGEILVQGPAVFAGYWQRPAATAERIADGWFRTGDLAVVDDGYVRLLGRATEVVISGGYNVYPAEVEDVLLGHPSVAEVAVSGVPSDEWGEVVTAWVVAERPASFDTAAVLSYAAQRLAPYKRPRQVRLVDALPRNAMGKVRRSDLR